MKNAPLNKKLIIIIAVIIAVVVAAAGTVTAVLLTRGTSGTSGGEPPVASDLNAQMEGNVLSWQAVDGASGYVVNINGKQYDVDTNVLDLDSIKVESGSLTIRIGVKRKDEEEIDYLDTVLFDYSPDKPRYEVRVVAQEGGSTNVTQQMYDANSEVRLVASPKEGYHFDGWYSDKLYKLDDSLEFAFNINSDTVLMAQFSKDAEPMSSTTQEDSGLMRCPNNFALMVGCSEVSAEEYIRNHLSIYDDYFFG